jgi:ABC-type multidrug transport system permease subunit
MASQERRRGARQKRKARAAERKTEIAARYERRNEAAREALEPLHQGERPLVVTIGAILSAAITASIIVAYVAGATVNGDRPRVLQVAAPALVMGMMAYGMWRVRYWAVLGFQAVLALLILAATLGLIGADRAVTVVANLGLIAVAGTPFYFMIRALARIQMPERRPRD